MKIVIIGGQGAGMTCATRLKRNIKSAEVIVIEKESYVSFGACGLPYYVGDEFSSEAYLFSKSKEELEQDGVIIKDGFRVENINTSKKELLVTDLANKTTYIETFDKLVLAMGAVPHKFPHITNFNSDCSSNIYSLTKLEDANFIKDKIKNTNIKDIAILGAGYIGLELLESFVNHHLKITIIDSKEMITHALLDEDFEPIINEEIRKHKIHAIMCKRIEKIIEKDNKIQIISTSGETLVVDLLVTALGFRPNTHLLKNTTIQTIPTGAIRSDKNGETNIKDIFACGDCACIHHKILNEDVYMPLATIANKMGRKIADYIAGIKNHFEGTLASSCLKILNLEVAKTGITEYEAKIHKIPYKAIFIKDYNHTNYYKNQKPIWVKLICGIDDKILGAQIVGEDGAMLRIHALSVAVEVGLSVAQLGVLDFAYAPPFNRTWDILNVAGNVLTKAKPK